MSFSFFLSKNFVGILFFVCEFFCYNTNGKTVLTDINLINQYLSHRIIVKVELLILICSCCSLSIKLSILKRFKLIFLIMKLYILYMHLVKHSLL